MRFGGVGGVVLSWDDVVGEVEDVLDAAGVFGIEGWLRSASRQHTPPAPPAAAPAPAPAAPLLTGEEVSGRAAAAIADMHRKMATRRDASESVAEQLTETLLQAHPVTTDGQQKLEVIQQRIEDAIADPKLNLDTPTGEQAFLQFLRSQVEQIRAVVANGQLASDDTARILAGLSKLVPSDTNRPSSSSDTTTPADTSSSRSNPAPDPGDAADPGSDSGVSADDAQRFADDAGDYADPGTPNSLAGLTQALPSMMAPLASMGGLPASMMSPLSSMGSMPPMGGMAPMQPMQATADQKPKYVPDDKTLSESDTPTYADDQTGDGTDTKPDDGKPDDKLTPQPGSDTPATTTAATPSVQVSLPDGSSVTAPNPKIAQAVTAYLKGTPLDAAFKNAGMPLPLPGTPITHGNIDPSQVTTGSIAVLGDHLSLALSPVKAFQDGQIVPLQDVANKPGFEGWLDPTKTATTAGAPS